MHPDGPYDVIVRAEARNLDELGKLVVARVQAVDGITRTLTCPVVHLGRAWSTPGAQIGGISPVGNHVRRCAFLEPWQPKPTPGDPRPPPSADPAGTPARASQRISWATGRGVHPVHQGCRCRQALLDHVAVKAQALMAVNLLGWRLRDPRPVLRKVELRESVQGCGSE
jgi:hypothetical protein